MQISSTEFQLQTDRQRANLIHDIICECSNF